MNRHKGIDSPYFFAHAALTKYVKHVTFYRITLNVNERDGEALSTMGEYGIAPAAMSEFLPSRFVLVYARVWHSVRWLENVRYAT